MICILEHPIIGYNVITYFEGEDVLLSMMKAMDSRVVRTVAEVLQREKAIEQTLGLVKVGKSGVAVAPNSVQNVKCVVRSKCLQGGRLVIFEPCGNL